MKQVTAIDVSVFYNKTITGRFIESSAVEPDMGIICFDH